MVRIGQQGVCGVWCVGVSFASQGPIGHDSSMTLYDRTGQPGGSSTVVLHHSPNLLVQCITSRASRISCASTSARGDTHVGSLFPTFLAPVSSVTCYLPYRTAYLLLLCIRAYPYPCCACRLSLPVMRVRAGDSGRFPDPWPDTPSVHTDVPVA